MYRVASRKGRPSGKTVVQDAPQAVNIGAAVGGMGVAALLRGDVVRAAERLAGGRQIAAGLDASLAVVEEGATQADVEDFDAALERLSSGSYPGAGVSIRLAGVRSR